MSAFMSDPTGINTNGIISSWDSGSSSCYQT